MSGFWTIYRRELAGLFLAPLAWVLLCLALALDGVLFGFIYLPGSSGNIGMSISFTLGEALPFWLIVLVLPPLLTMRMISEEARTGQLEFILTAPVSDAAVVLGKLLAATSVMFVLWSSVAAYAFTSQALGTAPDWLPVLTQVLGATLVSALFCAVGLAASAATNTPLLAAFLAFVAATLLISVPLIDGLLPLPPEHWLRYALSQMKLYSQFKGSFCRGIVDTKHVVTYLAWTGFFAFCATRLLETRRWR